jgi:L-asparaginase
MAFVESREVRLSGIVAPMRARMFRTATFLLTCLAAVWSAHGQTTPGQPPQAAAAQATPRVRLVATGGTISNRTGGRLTAEELVGLIPGLDRYVTAEVEQFSNTSSAQLSLDQWLTLARRVNQLFADDPGLAGIVVTSGTDTLEELAFFLHLTVRSDRPVAVVGSMRNPSTVGYEGAANLLDGFRVAASPDARGRGVMVVMNDTIDSARDVTKTDTLRLDTFESRSHGPLGVADTDRVVFYRRIEHKHTATSEFDVTTLTTLPRVDILMTYQGAPGDLIKAAVDGGAKGIVLATAGAGATSGTQFEGIRYAAEKGVFVVSSARAGSGRIAASRRTAGATSTGPQTRIQGEDLSPVKSRILLMLALTKTQSGADIQRMFLEY